MTTSSADAERARAANLARRLLNGYQATCVAVAAAKLGVFVALRPGPRDDRTLAEELGVDRSSLRRLLRALRVLGFVRLRGETIELTPLGHNMLPDALGHWAELIAEEYLPAWSKLQDGVATGRVAFETVFGMNVWEHRRQNPQLSASFNSVTASLQGAAIDAVLADFDLSSIGCVVDVGGGLGYFLSELLQACPSLDGVLLEQPHVVGDAECVLRASGVLDRCTVVGGSFFDAVPPGGDLLTLKLVLHDWADEPCVRILRRCREAMKPSARLLVIEHLLPEGDEPLSEHAVMLDIHMMAVLGGRERSLDQYSSLVRAADLELVRTVRGGAGLAILEAVGTG